MNLKVACIVGWILVVSSGITCEDKAEDSSKNADFAKDPNLKEISPRFLIHALKWLINKLTGSKKNPQTLPSQEYQQILPVKQYKQITPSQQYQKIVPDQEYNQVEPIQQYQQVSPSSIPTKLANTIQSTDFEIVPSQ